MSSYDEFKKFYVGNIILFIVLLFVIIYVIINWDFVSGGNYFAGEYVKPILITGIISLIFHLTLTWDDNETLSNSNSDSNEIIIPKYQLGKNQEQNQVQLPEIIQEPRINVPHIQLPQLPQLSQLPQLPQLPQFNPDNIQQNLKPNLKPNPFASKYQIANRFDTCGKNHSQSRSHSHSHSQSQSDNTKSNQNIFVSHRNSARYGIKF